MKQKNKTKSKSSKHNGWAVDGKKAYSPTRTDKTFPNITSFPKALMPGNGQRTYVVFGHGRVMVGAYPNPNNKFGSMLCFADTFKERKVGSVIPGEWKAESSGDEVFLSFENLESIDLVIRCLQDARKHMLAAKEALPDKPAKSNA